MSHRVSSQHSYLLNRFSSIPFDSMEHPTPQADLELDDNPPRVQLGDEMFVFQDGRWVKNCRLQSPLFSPSSSFHHKLHHKRLAKEYQLQEENETLQDENRALRDENKALRKENKILQVFREDHKVTLGHKDRRTSSPLLRKDAASQEVVRKDNSTLPVQCSKENTLQPLQEEVRALQQQLEQRQTYWVQTEDKTGTLEENKPVPSSQEEPHSPGLLPDQDPGLSSHFQPKGPSTPQEDSKTLHALQEMVGNLSGSAGKEEGKVSPNLTDSRQPLQLLREIGQELQALQEENRLLHEENRALNGLVEEHRVFKDNKTLWENNKMKLQQRLVIDTVTEVTARMEMLIEDLCAFMPTKNKEPKKPSRI